MNDEEKVRKRIEKRLGRSENSKAREEFEQGKLFDEFEAVLFRINHKHEDIVDDAVKAAKKVKEYNDWPENREKFWDLEAANWKYRVPVHVKDFISAELKKRIGDINLDIGSGSSSYVKGVSLDISYEMLYWNGNKDKVQGTGENLPFKKGSFDSVTMVFTANYTDFGKIAKEISKVLKKRGKAICVQSAKPVHKLHQLAENKDFSVDKIMYEFNKLGLKVRKELKKAGNTELVFIEGQKP